MGDIADMMIDGTLDEQTGEYIGDAVGYPRTRQKGHYNTIPFVKDNPAQAKIRTIRKELAILIKKKQEELDPQPVNNARKEINIKYGKGWRFN